MAIMVTAECFGAVRIGAHRGQPPLAFVGEAGPHLLAGDTPSAVHPRVADVRTAAASDPAPGSENNWHQLTLPSKNVVDPAIGADRRSRLGRW